jgi:hypothetical protein
MTRQRFETRHALLAHAARVDAAKLQALQARREAIDEFWSAIGRGIAAALRALRAARPAVGYLAKS